MADSRKRNSRVRFEKEGKDERELKRVIDLGPREMFFLDLHLLDQDFLSLPSLRRVLSCLVLSLKKLQFFFPFVPFCFLISEQVQLRALHHAH